MGGVDFGEEEQRTEEEGNEEPETDFPLSNMNRIYRYLGKEGEHRLLELKDQVTSNPRVFGAQLEKLVVPENKEEMRRFLKKVVQLKEEIKSEEDLLTTIDRESGAQEFAFPDGCVLKEAEFFYCLNHGDPLFQNTNVCTQCFQIFQNDHPGERGDPKNFRCLKGFKYNVGEGIANVLNNLGKEDLDKFFETQRKSRDQTFNSFKSEEHNIFDISSGLWYISALEKGLAEGVDLFLNLSLSVDAVEVRKKGSTVKKVYPVWIILNNLPFDLRSVCFFFLLPLLKQELCFKKNETKEHGSCCHFQ